ncbi:hypothetical protein OEZ85_002872 [Tetradesmus obliquus]|uniref:Uncharacterized protein n=1 Tax=Tetradesmus obliquus TaxID=3088 RepID=A0ABY8U3U3_TETOB|nr:hypothetical protein OEZ85_002872 [Tetradesmus obliquus]
MQYKDNRQQATSQFSKETASFMRDLLKDKKLSRRIQQEVQDSWKGSTGSWVDLVSSQTASFQPPASQATQLVQFALGREGAAALQHASLARTTAAAAAAKQRPAASVKEQLVDQAAVCTAGH